MRRWLRPLGIVIGVAVIVVVVALGGVYGFSGRRLSRSYASIQPETIHIPSDSASIARGRHLVAAVASCMECHGPNLGGGLVVDGGALIGTLYAPNLTRGKGGIGASFTDADWVRAIRHGVAPDGRPLIVMPADDYTNLSDADLGAIIAYVKSVPPVDRSEPSAVVGPLARALFLAGKFPLLPAERIDHDMARPAEVSAAPTREYGAYLARSSCQGCHRANMAGGPVAGSPPGTPPAANLTPAGIGNWTEADFFHAIRTGKRPDGTVLNSFMPWATFRNMTDDELRALWLYVRSLPPAQPAAA